MERTGMVHIYTGDGKGKTTAGLGLGIRACGSGMKVLMVQFLKSSNTSELNIIKKLEPDFQIIRGFNCKKFVWNMTQEEKENASQEAGEIFDRVKSAVLSGQYDLVILDELLGVVSQKFLDADAVADMVKNKPKELELVMTGRNAPEILIELADYVSEIKAIKHPYEKGVPARKGIEF